MAHGIEDVARRAGVSVATVSRALRGLPNVSEKTRLRVIAAADELDYVITPSASRLASGQTRTIGLVTTYIGRYYFSQVLAGAEKVLHEAGYDVLLYSLPNEEVRRDFFERMPLRRRVDAVLLNTLPLSQRQMDQFRALHVPVSAVGLSGPGISSVRIDDAEGARTATNHLINLGHTRVAMIGGGQSDTEPNPFTTPEDRRRGYVEALAEAGIPFNPRYVRDGRYTPSGGQEAMGDLLGLAEPPTGVFAQSDRMAMGAMRALRIAGLSCPMDVSVVGFDDHEIAEPLDLTTIAQPMREQGARAARQLLDMLEGAPPTETIIPTHLILRGSTCPPLNLRRSEPLGLGASPQSVDRPVEPQRRPA